MKYSVIVVFILISCSFAHAQSRQRESSRDNVRKEIDRSTTYDIETKKVRKKKLKRSLSKDFDRKIEEYEKRMEANVKKYDKMAQEMKKPQYADPTYFGHKRKPKKRPPGKKKFCKECEMYH